MKRLALASTFLFVSAVLSATDPTSFGLDLDVQPASDGGSYVCHAKVTDLATGEDLMVPTITLLADAPATLSTVGREYDLTLTVTIASGGSKATADLKVSHAGKVVASQRSTLAIR